MDVVELSRLQFALTAMYHFLFVPLTLGLSFMLVIMEATYVMTGRPIWRTITRFWGTLFGINFVLGVATGLTMEFEFGTNWAYYSHYVGDIFGAPLAIEGLMAFFLEATFVGLMFFGWGKLSKPAHLFVTCMVALGANLSALWILVANGWMQNPAGAVFNPETMRMEVTSFGDVLFNPVAQAKFVHTVSAGYVCGAVFVLGVSAWMLLRGKWPRVARRSIAVASAFGLASSLSVVVLGDQSGYVLTDNQRMKLAALEAMWHTEPAPASFTAFGIPSMADHTTHAEVKIPYLLGLIATRSLDRPVAGIDELVALANTRITNGIQAYDGMMRMRADPNDAEARALFEAHRNDLGYALLLRRYVDDPRTADAALIAEAARDTVPNVPVMFWTFRIMMLIGFVQIAFFALACWLVMRRRFTSKWFLRTAVCMLPLPWIAMEAGWLLAELGRQPWAVEGVLPTFLGVSSLTAAQVWSTIIGFTVVYGALAVVEIALMVRAIQRGPYPHRESGQHASPDASHPAGAE